MVENEEDVDMEVPEGLRGLRACMFCSLLKTQQQFEATGCSNCGFLNMKGDREKVLELTSASYEGIIALIHPKESWVARWQRVASFNRGLYAIQVNGEIKDEVLANLEGSGIRQRPRVRTAKD